MTASYESDDRAVQGQPPQLEARTIGSLFSGVGGLDLAVEEVFEARTVWQVEANPSARAVLAKRFAVPIYEDVTTVNWSTVEPVDILAGGFPCQDVSAAGLRKGIAEGTRSGLWSYFAEAIGALRPQYVVIENVKGLLSAKAAANGVEHTHADVARRGSAFGRILGDLAELGYDAKWKVLPASAVGAPHRRDRVFILAQPSDPCSA